MSTDDSIAIVARFNQCVSARDIEGLSALMTDDHVFIDSANNVVRGKEAVVAAWMDFFRTFPDYRNIFDGFRVEDPAVIASGRSVCADDRLNGPALWRAVVSGQRISEWRVYDDTIENRALLGM
jgi:ketosteroid isomerase-like protein